MKIAIQGIKGSFHHQATQKILQNQSFDLVECHNFRQVFECVQNNKADYGLVAIENNLHGSINEVYRLLQANDVWITRDLRMQISQNLISHIAQSLEELKQNKNLKVISHPVALAQIEKWLDNNLPNATRQEFSDTAASVKHIVEKSDKSLLAVASPFACKTYGGQIVAGNIQDDNSNYTRFILFSKTRQNPIYEPTHCSMIITTDHKPGALLRCLEVFDRHGCNLTKLDSQPIPGDEQHYSFYIDYELGDNDHAVINELTKQSASVKILGRFNRI